MNKKIYNKNPLNSFFNEQNIDNCVFAENEIILEKNNCLLEYFSESYLSKINFDKGYNKIILNDNNYNKKFLKYNKIFCYKMKELCKGIKYVNAESELSLQISLLDDLNFKNINVEDEDKYKFITVIFEKNEETIKLLKEVGFNDFANWFLLERVDRDNVHTKEDFTNKLLELTISNKKPKLLLHSCCAPCSSQCLKLLNEYFEITIFYYNPNIFPEEEYQKRLNEQKRIVECLGYSIPIIKRKYDNNEYKKAISGINDIGESGIRCFACYEFRLEECAKLARDNSFDYFTTTLSISPYKNSNKINEIGIKLQEKYGCNFLYSNFKLNDGYKKSIQLSKEFNLYRQDYCGCEHSINFKNN